MALEWVRSFGKIRDTITPSKVECSNRKQLIGSPEAAERPSHASVVICNRAVGDIQRDLRLLMYRIREF
jgi:hypothetical protein